MQINLLAYTFLKYDGYGRHGMHLMRSLARAGVQVTPIAYEITKWDGFTQRLAGIDWSKVTLCLMSGFNVEPVPGRQWVYTMWESDKLPDGWAQLLNRVAERVIVPCEWNKDVFINCGVKRPIHVVGEGIDPSEFPQLDRPPNNGMYTFLSLGDRAMRKGDDLVYMAFCRAFRDIPDARLLIKTRGHGFTPINTTLNDGTFPDPLNKRIAFWREDVDTMADVYAQTDCFVYPARSGGWELPPREAAAMGIPVIAPRHTGMVAGIDDWATVVLERFKPTKTSILGGHWYTPDVDEIADAMLWCYHNRHAAVQKGAAASQWLRENQTWSHAAGDLIALLREYG